jgi:5-methylcytosine-specific restriction endonuclease McrA
MDLAEFRSRITQAHAKLALTHKTYSKRQLELRQHPRQQPGRPKKIISRKPSPLTYETASCLKCSGTSRYLTSGNCVACHIKKYSPSKVSRANKEVAKTRGIKTYFNLKPCSICSHQERYVSTGQCAFCVRKRRHNRRSALGTYTYEQWLSLLDLTGHICLACKTPDSFNILTVDHVIPLCKGGTNFIENIQPLCLRCNKIKHDQHIDYRIGTHNN